MNEMMEIGSLGTVYGKEGFMKLRLNQVDLYDRITHPSCKALLVAIDAFRIPFLIDQVDEQRGLIRFLHTDEKDRIRMGGCRIFLAEKSEASDRDDHTAWIGFILHDRVTNDLVGTILSMEEYPAHPMLIVRREEREILVPLVTDWNPEVDWEKRKVSMDLPEGLVD